MRDKWQRKRVMLGVGLGLVLAGCTQVPELGERVRPELVGADYPALVPIESLLGARATPQDDAETLERGLQGRIARLKSRAGALQAPVVDPDTRARMAGGVDG